ncbi:MAG: hemerythrin domain-containing protein [Patescibacteria group bacterium]|nr:hemerythrin domain-containing protein [Patescibacteria group bacterium]
MEGLVSNFMDADHAYLDKLWVGFLGEENNPESSSELLKRFKRHLLLHIELEDNFLFPLLNSHINMGINPGLLAMAKRDHRNIIKLLAMVEEAGLGRDIREIKAASRHLHRALEKHRLREDEIHYPVCDFFVEPEEWNSALSRIYGKRLEKDAREGNKYLEKIYG